jgi:DNA-binding MarR family transcriptional regulator
MNDSCTPEHEALVERLVEVGQDFFQTTAKMHSRKQWIDVDLTMLQMRVLLIVTGANGTPMSQLARATGKTLSTATGVVDRMVTQGLVRREHVPSDRRLVLIHSTEAGRILVNKLTEISHDHMRMIAKRLSTEEINMITHALEVIRNVMHGIPEEELESIWDKYDLEIAGAGIESQTPLASK